MNNDIQIEVCKPGALGGAERAAWEGFVAASPRLQSPFFAWPYLQAAGRTAPGAAVAVVRRKGEIVGFLPFQKRGGLVQPLGAPLTDYHGIVCAPDAQLDLAALTRALGAGEYRFTGLCAQRAPAGSESEPVWQADVSSGFDAYQEGLRTQSPKLLKEVRRKTRGLETDFGPLSFAWERDPALLDWIIAHKRDQYRRTLLHDVFACGWTERLLRELQTIEEPGFAGRIGVLRAGGRLMAASFDLHGDDVHYVWFPAYEAEASRWSPGTLLYLKIIEHAAAEGVHTVDFGPGDHGKRFIASPSGVVHQGRAFGSAWRAGASAATGRLLAPAPKLEAIRTRAGRRFNIITACETDPAAWLGGAARAARRLLSRPAGAEMTAN